METAMEFHIHLFYYLNNDYNDDDRIPLALRTENVNFCTSDAIVDSFFLLLFLFLLLSLQLLRAH